MLYEVITTMNALRTVHQQRDEFHASTLTPPFQNLSSSVTVTHPPPELTLPPAVFFHALVDHYLFIALHEIAYQSLMAENTRRIEHIRITSYNVCYTKLLRP